MNRPYAPPGYAADISPADAGFGGIDVSPNSFREWYSWAVVASVASAAGLVCHVPTIDVQQKDILVETYGSLEGRQRSIRIQAKASSSLGTAAERGIDFVTHQVGRAYYDKLREPSTIPLFLVLIALPPLGVPWTRIRPSIHALSAAAWWGKVEEPSNGRANQTIRVPASQRLDLDGFRAMLEAA